mmetsp:Transcript_34220/g.55473  ORF Transcript_34220/g.55473 Transcript_34220/m.55473 type:complete len:129 (-) Transcript_34220:1573-1959(-)
MDTGMATRKGRDMVMEISMEMAMATGMVTRKGKDMVMEIRIRMVRVMDTGRDTVMETSIKMAMGMEKTTATKRIARRKDMDIATTVTAMVTAMDMNTMFGKLKRTYRRRMSSLSKAKSFSTWDAIPML